MKNTLYFRTAQPDEKREKTRNIFSNILMGILFVLMIIVLPIAIIVFTSKKHPFTRLNFEYSDTHDFVLILSDTHYKWDYEPSIDSAV